MQLVDNTKNVLSDFPTTVSFQPIDFGESAQRAIGQLTSSQSKPIEFTFHTDPEHQIVLASGLLQEHIYNLLQNAVDAVTLAMMRGRMTQGRISVTVERLQDAVSTAPRRVALRISDNGVGFPSGLEARILEYGFTTKGEHGGTGYGLPAARDYARSFGGDLRLESGGDGATVIMILQEYSAQYHGRLLQRFIAPGKA